jgi:putative adhesin
MPRLPAITLILIAAGCAQAADKTLDRTFTVSPGGTLVVDADGSSVHVSGSDSNQVVVHMVFKASEKDLAGVTLDAVQNGNNVTATMKKEKKGWSFWWGNWSGEQEIEIKVPRQYVVNVRTGGGSIELRDTVGAAILKTSGGSISAKNLVGNIELDTSGGSIVAETIRGDVDADTSGGSVRLERIDGKIRGNTSGGSVTVSLVGANRGISATTSGGGIELRLPKGTTANIDASTSGGNVNTELPVTTTELKETRLVGTLNGGGAAIYAHTSGGSVSLRAE